MEVNKFIDFHSHIHFYGGTTNLTQDKTMLSDGKTKLTHIKKKKTSRSAVICFANGMSCNSIRLLARIPLCLVQRSQSRTRAHDVLQRL